MLNYQRVSTYLLRYFFPWTNFHCSLISQHPWTQKTRHKDDITNIPGSPDQKLVISRMFLYQKSTKFNSVGSCDVMCFIHLQNFQIDHCDQKTLHRSASSSGAITVWCWHREGTGLHCSPRCYVGPAGGEQRWDSWVIASSCSSSPKYGIP